MTSPRNRRGQSETKRPQLSMKQSFSRSLHLKPGWLAGSSGKLQVRGKHPAGGNVKKGRAERPRTNGAHAVVEAAGSEASLRNLKSAPLPEDHVALWHPHPL